MNLPFDDAFDHPAVRPDLFDNPLRADRRSVLAVNRLNLYQRHEADSLDRLKNSQGLNSNNLLHLDNLLDTDLVDYHDALTPLDRDDHTRLTRHRNGQQRHHCY